MKNALINHLVNAITKHNKIIIIITVILCILSLISIFTFLKVDLSMKGMAGYKIKEVNQFTSSMKKFNVSGITMVLLSPYEELEQSVLSKHEEINGLLYSEINNNENAIERVISIFKEFYEKKRRATFNTKTTIYISIDMLNLIQEEERNKLIKNLESIKDSNKNRIISIFNSKNPEFKELLYRFIQLLSYDDMVYLFSQVDTLSINQKEKLCKTIIKHLSINDKIRFVKGLNVLSESLKEQLISRIDKIDKELEILLDEFEKIAGQFTKDLERILFSDEKPDITSMNNMLYSPITEAMKKKQQKMDGIFAGVLYSDELSYSNDRLMYMLLIVPENDLSIITNSRLFIINLDRALNRLKEKYKTQVTITRTGWAVTGLDEEKTILDGFIPMSIITVVGILLIFLIGLKRLIYPLLSMIPLLIGVLIMFGIYAVTIQIINLVTIISPIILFGIGIDYAIHIGARYGEVRAELGENAPQSEVLRNTFKSIGDGLTIGAITTILSFLALISSLIVSFNHLAIMASSGVLCSFLAMVYIMPIIITWRERKFKKVDKNFLSSKKLVGFGRLVNSTIGTVIAVIIILIGLTSFFLIPRLEVETDKDSLLPKNIESVQASKMMGRKLDVSFVQTFFILDSYDSLIEFEREVNRKDENGRNYYTTINNNSIISARTAIREFERLGWDKNIDTLDQYVEKLANRTGFLGTSNERKAILSEFFVRNYVNWKTNEFLVITSPTGYVWQKDFFKRHKEDLLELEKNVTEKIRQNKLENIHKLKEDIQELENGNKRKIDELSNQIKELEKEVQKIEQSDEPIMVGSGIVKIWGFLTSNMLRDLFVSSIFAFIVILLVLILTTKSVKGTLICALSLFISIIATLGVIALFQIKLNFVNILAFPIIIGLGIDYSVHIYYRIMEEKGLDIVLVLSSTGKAVLLTTLTTLMAFSSISFSLHPGIASLGQFAVIGLSLAFLSSIFVIPFFVKIFYKNRIN